MTYVDTIASAAGCLGGYRLGDVIGIGGTAEVRLGWPVGCSAAGPVAVKRLRPMVADDVAAAACLRHELRLLRAISHPSIVRALDGDATDGRPFLAMELLDGGSLQGVLRARTPMDPAQVSDLVRGVADALRWLHRRGITHADVKPANLLRDNAGRVKLIDFGVACASGSVAGFVSPAYAAPDLLLGLPPDPRDDVFSLAVVIYELLTARHPFGDDPVLAIGLPDRPAALDRASWAPLLAAFASSRSDRPRDPSELIAALDA